jgi:ABC-2 type transport system permease protein
MRSLSNLQSLISRCVRVKNLRLYFEIARRSFRRATAYRSAYIAGLLTNAFFGALRCFVYIALYGAGSSVAGFTLNDAISYTWITQSLISIGAGWIDTRDLMQTIRSGDVVADLMRPWSFFGYWLSRSLGERIYNLLARGSLTYLIGVLYFRAHVPSAEEALGFAASIGLALLVSFALNFLVNLSAFWLMDDSGVSMIVNVLLQFFSGFLVPLAFFPAPLAALARVLPFQAITGLPAQVFLGQIGGAALGQTLLLQLFWALVLGGLALLMLRAAMHKVVIQGG